MNKLKKNNKPLGLSILIEKMKEEDLDEILAIEKICFPTPWTKGMFLQELSLDIAFNFVAKAKKNDTIKVVGYVCFWFFAGETHILNLAVSPEYQSKGIATKLLEYVHNLVIKKGGFVVFLEVRPSNKKALSLYKKMGYKVEGIRKRYYNDTGEDAIIMEKRLQEGKNEKK